MLSKTYIHTDMCRGVRARVSARVHISYVYTRVMYGIVYNSDNYNASFMISNNNS